MTLSLLRATLGSIVLVLWEWEGVSSQYAYFAQESLSWSLKVIRVCIRIRASTMPGTSLSLCTYYPTNPQSDLLIMVYYSLLSLSIRQMREMGFLKITAKLTIKKLDFANNNNKPHIFSARSQVRIYCCTVIAHCPHCVLRLVLVLQLVIVVTGTQPHLDCNWWVILLVIKLLNAFND